MILNKPFANVHQNMKYTFFHIRTVHPAIIEVFYYQLMHKRIVFERGDKIYIKITITATCFGVITTVRERTV